MFRFPALLLGVALSPLLATQAHALSTPARAVGPTTLQGCDELTAEFALAENDWRARYRAAEGHKDRSALRKEKPAVLFHERFEQLAEVGEGCAYLWLIRHVDDGPTPIPERLARRVTLYEELFAAALDETTIREGTALLFKDSKLRRKLGFSTVERLASLALAAAGSEQKTEIELEFALTISKSRDKDELARGLALLREWLASHPDAKQAKSAEERLFMLEHLSVGALAPDFTGQTIDGETIHLADYRGQVVVLDFFGFW